MADDDFGTAREELKHGAGADALPMQVETSALPMQAEFSNLFKAARHSKLSEVQDGLDAGARIDGRDEHGNTLLHVAAQNGHKKLLKLLLRRGANVNLQNNKGNTPLHYCYAYGYGDLGKEYLVEKAGAHTHIRNHEGLTAEEGIRKQEE